MCSVLQRTLNSLQVYCSFKEVGCEWVGELGGLCEHLNVSPSDDYKDSGCPFVQLECCYCEGYFQRQFLRDHENDACLERPFTCVSCYDYESTFADVTTNHTPICPCRVVPCPNNCGESFQRNTIKSHLSSTCPLEVINCSFKFAGCEERFPRKEMPVHINGCLTVQRSLPSLLENFQNRIQKLEKEVLSAQSESFIRAHLRILPVTIVMNGFSEKKESNSEWTCEPFYTHPRGYKMFLCIVVNGKVSKKSTHVSIFASLMCGEFDNQLDGPFRGSIIVQLLDQEEGEDNIEEEISFVSASKSSFRVTNGNCSHIRRGFSMCESHDDLRLRYLKDDTLCFKLFYRPYIRD